jgi:hypothetical protein
MLVRFARGAILCTAIMSTTLAGCQSSTPTLTGHWVSEQSSAVALDLYPDGTATISNLNVLDLKWKTVDPFWVRIDALGARLSFNFRVTNDKQGLKGTLQATGYDTLTFRKQN